MIVPSFSPAIGGAEVQVQRLSKELVARGWTVRVLTRRHGSALPHGLPTREVVDGIPVTRLYSCGRGKIGSLLYMLGGLWHLLRHGRRGIYHAHAIGAAGWLAVVARYLLGGRSIIKLRTGCHTYDKYLASPFRHWQFSTLLRLTDLAVVVNSEVEELVLNSGIPTTRIVRIPNAVDTTFFHPVLAGEKAAIRRQLGLPIKKTIVLFVGRLEPIKGGDVLLRAWALLPDEVRANGLLVFVGGGTEQATLTNMANSLGVRETVLLTGPQRAVRDYYWAADIFVLPSQTEGLSNALIEAMACGLPVISSKVGGSPDVVEEGISGMLFESGNHEQLAQKLVSMIVMQNRWVEMGTHARQSVQLNADLLPTVGRLMEVYRSLS